MSNLMMKAIFVAVFMATTCVPGCIFSNPVVFDKCEDRDNCLTIAFEAKEEYSNTEENPEQLADRLSELLGMEVEIYPVDGPAGTIQALRYGHADIGFLDGGAAWLSWQNYGLEVLAAEQKADGRPHYYAIAWVHKDSDIAQAAMDDDNSTDPFALMEGKISCHTSALGSSGMLLPMGYLIDNGYMDVVGNPDDISSLGDTVRNYFSEDSSIPNSGTKYYKYKGSLRCLAEHELGDATDYISFAKDPTVPDYCGDDPEDWCFEGDFTSTEDFYPLPTTGRAPSHPVMYNPEFFSAANVTALQDAFAAMNGNSADLEILDNVLSTPGMTITNTTEHISAYGESIGDVPGIQAYFSDKYGLED